MSMAGSWFFVCLLLTAAKSDDVASFHGHIVVRAVPSSDQHLQSLNSVSEKIGHDFDFWKAPTSVGRAVDIMSPPDHSETLLNYLSDLGMEPDIKVADVQRLVSRQLANISDYRTQPASCDPARFDFYQYHSYDCITYYLHGLAATHPDFVTLGSLGKSHEGRDMWFVKIGYPSAEKKRAVYIDAGIHAREWIAPALALYTIGQLTTNSSFVPLLRQIDVIIAPEINPDGYEYSRTKNRMWRKSRSGPYNRCYGVDINRNFAYKWGLSGASPNPCSDIYNGPSPMSEIEAKNTAAFLEAMNDTIVVYLTLHSFGEYILYPWGYAYKTYPSNVAQLKSLADEMYTAIQGVYGTQYTVGNSADVLYPAAGASDDYGRFVGIPYVYTIELRPGTGDRDNDDAYGFVLPASHIQRTALETFPAFVVAFNRAAKESF